MDQDERILGEGDAGPSNPLRVGVAAAGLAVREALDRACTAARVRRADIFAIQIGLAGARRKELSARMEDALRNLGIAELEVVSDADIALFGATDGEPGLQLTGQLGDVMKESAQIALSYVRSHAEQLGVDPKALDRRIHVHVPAGAVPKDGPSAGVTMVTALVSMATGRQVRSDVGMTGEVTLNGRVLPIGGVKQKLLAAQRAGLSTVFIPQRNEADLDDVPADVLESLDVKPMTDVADIVAQALEPADSPATAAA